MTKVFVMFTLLGLFFFNSITARAEEPIMGNIMSCSTESAAEEQIERTFGIGKEAERWDLVLHDINSRKNDRVCDITLTEFTVARVIKTHTLGGNRVVELVELKITFMMEAVAELPGIRMSSHAIRTRYTFRVQKGTVS